jgi:CRP/FNR family nitrogen fixation transcriptional regulator
MTQDARIRFGQVSDHLAETCRVDDDVDPHGGSSSALDRAAERVRIIRFPASNTAVVSRERLRILAGTGLIPVKLGDLPPLHVFPDWEATMLTNISTDLGKKPRLLGELGELSHTRVSSAEYKYRRRTEIFGAEEPAEYIYQVIEGAVRSYKLLSDGRRQIGGFHLPGDIFGLEDGDLHRFTAEAIVNTTVRFMKRESLERVAKTDLAIVRSILTMTTDNLRHAENHLLLLGRKTSLERVAAFLVEMDRRLAPAGVIALPMNRRDIADYLGLTLETVSRALSTIQKKGFLKFAGQTHREIAVLNPAGLAELAECAEFDIRFQPN